MNICYINIELISHTSYSAIFIHIMHIMHDMHITILYNSLHRNTKTYNIINNYYY